MVWGLNTLSQTLSAAGKLRVRSALNPALYFLLIGVPAGLYLLGIGGGILPAVIGAMLICIPIVVFAVGFIYFMIKDPDKLRSEEYELRKTALTMIEQKGGAISIVETSVEAIANPHYQESPKSISYGDDSE